jgi:SAM-dependent methyltransferase
MVDPILLEIRLPVFLGFENLQTVNCPICSKPSSQITGTIIINDVPLCLNYCNNDDVWWISPRPPVEFYKELYEKCFYHSPIPEQFGYACLETDNTRRKEKAVLNWDDIEKNVKYLQKKSFLEIGCATGEMLTEALQRGWDEIKGIEIEPECCEIAQSNGLPVVRASFENMEPLTEAFDLIFADNVIEHLMDPQQALLKCARMQTSGDCLILRLPDTQSEGPTLKLIDHTYHFTRTSISTILSMSGYHVHSIFHSGTYLGPKEGQRIENMTVIAYKI